MRLMSRMAILAVLLAGVSPAQAQTGGSTPEEYVPTFARADYWLHANGSRIGNIDAMENRFVKWDATKPAGSETAIYHGNNYPFIVGGELHDPDHFLTMEGTAGGDLDAIAFDLYFIGWAQSTIQCGLSLSFRLLIDDQTILEQDFTGSAGIRYQAVNSTTVRTRFVLTNLWEASKQAGLAYGPDVKHKVYLNIQNFYVCNELTWLYDAADVPSGLIVNLPAPRSGYTEIDVLNPPPPL